MLGIHTIYLALFVVQVPALPSPATPETDSRVRVSDPGPNAASNHPLLAARILPNQQGNDPSGDDAPSESGGTDASSRSGGVDRNSVENSFPHNPDSPTGTFDSPQRSPFGDDYDSFLMDPPNSDLEVGAFDDEIPSPISHGTIPEPWNQDGGEGTHYRNTVRYRTLLSKDNDGRELNQQVAEKILDQPKYWLKTGRQSLSISLNDNSLFSLYAKRFSYNSRPIIDIPFVPVIKVDSKGSPAGRVLLSIPLLKTTKGAQFDFKSQDVRLPEYAIMQGSSSNWLEARIVPAENNANQRAKESSYPFQHIEEPERQNKPYVLGNSGRNAFESWHIYSFSVRIQDILQGRELEAGDRIQLIAYGEHNVRGEIISSASIQLFGSDVLMSKFGSKLQDGIDPQSEFPLVANAVFVNRGFELADRNPLTYNDVEPGIQRDIE